MKCTILKDIVKDICKLTSFKYSWLRPFFLESEEEDDFLLQSLLTEEDELRLEGSGFCVPDNLRVWPLEHSTDSEKEIRELFLESWNKMKSVLRYLSTFSIKNLYQSFENIQEKYRFRSRSASGFCLFLCLKLEEPFKEDEIFNNLSFNS